MDKLAGYRGAGQFGAAYQYMYEHGPYAEGSVDQVLPKEMVLLCKETAPLLYGEFTPTKASYFRGSRPQLEERLRSIGADSGEARDRLAAIIRSCRELGQGPEVPVNEMIFGGTEEEIIVRGSDFCNELARVACAMAQVAGLPARIVDLADTQKAYWGHVIIEAYYEGTWGAADPTWDVIYRSPDNRPASIWQLKTNPDWIVHCGRGTETPSCNPGAFRAAAIANYSVSDKNRYDYSTSRINDYYRAILEQSARGWPGGSRWLYGEDKTDKMVR